MVKLRSVAAAIRVRFPLGTHDMKTEKIFSGIAGEYFVAGELSRRGFIAAVTLRNTAGVDIVASNERDSVNIQVKTRTVEKTSGSWQMGNKPLETKKEWNKSFYVFVAIHSNPENQDIDYYVIPKNILNGKMENITKRFLKKSKKTKQTLERCRRVLFLDGQYSFPTLKKLKNRWDIIFSQNPISAAKKIMKSVVQDDKTKSSKRVCLCKEPLCAKCLGINCEDKNCKIHTINNKKMWHKRWEIANKRKFPHVVSF